MKKENRKNPSIKLSKCQQEYRRRPVSSQYYIYMLWFSTLLLYQLLIVLSTEQTVFFFYIGKKITFAIVYDPTKCAPVTTSCTVHDFDGRNDFYFFSTKNYVILILPISVDLDRIKKKKKQKNVLSRLFYTNLQSHLAIIKSIFFPFDIRILLVR